MINYSRLLKIISTLFIIISSNCFATNNVILFVWDGLRPDSITQSTTPNLYKLAENGTRFNDNHSSFPTFTMMNASSFATGHFAGKTGFYGNILWNNKAKGVNSAGQTVDFKQPVFTEDYKVLTDLNKEEPLTEVFTLFSQAHKAGMITAAIGKSGPAYFQDYNEKGVIFDEKHVYPEDFANYLKSINYPLPANTVYRYNNFTLNKDNGNPTSASKITYLKDEVTTDPSAGLTSPYNSNNTYLMDSYLTQVMPKYKPALSVIWLRNPDSTEHNYGVGTAAYYDAIANQDNLLGKLIDKLKQTGQLNNTNIMVVSDHGHSNVSGNLSEFPTRTIVNGTVGNIDNINGYSVSGDFRPADLLTKAGFTAYDGDGCQYNPVLSGIRKNGSTVYPISIDKDGSICGGKPETKYTTAAYKVPAKLPPNAIIVAANGGSTYFYVPSHDKALIKKLVRYCQSRAEFGAVFTDARYGDIPGTLKLQTVKLQNWHNRNPDIIVSSNYNENERIQGFAGIEYNSGGSNRGMHGSFSPIDVHNTLIAYGPNFKKNYIDQLPSGNVDVPTTIAYLLGFKLVNTDGRILYEALSSKNNINSHTLKINNYQAQTPATNLTMQLATSPQGVDIDKNISNYNIMLQTKSILQDGKEYSYFDWAKAIRY